MARPQHSKRDRGREHVGLPPKTNPERIRRCESRIPTGHGVWTYCVRPWNHQGEHHYGH